VTLLLSLSENLDSRGPRVARWPARGAPGFPPSRGAIRSAPQVSGGRRVSDLGRALSSPRPQPR
jgi:hypothetical protein